MTTRSRGAGAGFGWLMNGIRVVFRHPKPLFGGAALLLVVAMLPSLITLPIQFHAITAGTPPSLATNGWIMLGSALFGLLIVPLYAGYLQVIDAAERGLPARAADIFKPYRQGEALRLVGYGLAILLAYFVMFAIIIVATGGHIASWYIQVLTAQANQLPPPTSLPDGFGMAMALFALLTLFMMGFYAISLGQVALNKASVFGAIADGAIGALKNALPLLVLVLCSILAWIVVAIVFAIVAVVLALLAKLIGAWLMLVVLVPLYIALLLLAITTMFGVMYQLWRDVCGGDVAVAMPPPLAA
jgi:hypothetical protein